MKIDKHILTSAKIAFFVYIVLSPFINHKYISFLNTTYAKVLLLMLIVSVSFVDLQLSIIMTLAFLILVINLNKDIIFGIKKKPIMYNLSEHFAEKPPFTEIVSEFPDKCEVEHINTDQISDDLYNLYIDHKIKPYEMYIRALSNKEAIEEATESKIIGWD